MKRILLISLLFIIGCNRGGEGHEPVLQISGFEDQVNEFQSQLNVQVNDLIIKFDDSLQAQGYAGICYPGSLSKSPEVHISTQFWNSASSTDRRIVAFHEMGHCVLNRLTHRNDFLNGYPASIMNYCMCSFGGGADSYFNANESSYYFPELWNGSPYAQYRRSLEAAQEDIAEDVRQRPSN